MPRIEAWKCPHTGKLFEDEKTYYAHLKRQARARINQRKWQTVLDGISDVIVGAQQVNNCQELVDYIIAHQREFIINGILRSHSDQTRLRKAIDEGWDFEFPRILTLKIDTTWCAEVSNSHTCPRDGYTNWGGREKDCVCHYPGWRGRIELVYDCTKPNLIARKTGKKPIVLQAPSISDMTGGFGSSNSLCGINTGSGGVCDDWLYGGNYDVSLFQSDFPNMEKAVTFAIMNGKSKNTNWGSGIGYEELDKLGVGKYTNLDI